MPAAIAPPFHRQHLHARLITTQGQHPSAALGLHRPSTSIPIPHLLPMPSCTLFLINHLPADASSPVPEDLTNVSTLPVTTSSSCLRRQRHRHKASTPAPEVLVNFLSPSQASPAASAAPSSSP
ncbi:hypothetical protein AMECASPLE_002473 [Ameca splendens]|uniref:Uncharacterized protein n=1 Tax=Ameca splendens TaxID=208324 RepID=A0ABV0XBD9_9TELE